MKVTYLPNIDVNLSYHEVINQLLGKQAECERTLKVSAQGGGIPNIDAYRGGIPNIDAYLLKSGSNYQ